MNRIGLYLGFPPHGGGAFQYAQSILAALSMLSQCEFEVLAAYSHPAWQDILADYSAVKAIKVEEGRFVTATKAALRFGFPINCWRNLAVKYHGFTKSIIKLDCNLWVFPSQDVWSYALPVPTVGVIHDLMHRYEKQFPEVSGYGLYARRERHYRNLCQYTQAILVDSKVGKQHVLEAYAPASDKVHELPFVVPPYMEISQATNERDYVLPKQYIFYPAQFWAHKNHIRLIQAFSKVSSSFPDLHLVLVGSKKNAFKAVLKCVDALGLEHRVHLLGYVKDESMRYLYTSARALIFPSFFGPTNIPPLEALAVGCPMAVSDVYAMPDRLGDAAIYFDPLSVDQISEAISRLAGDEQLCSTLRKNGQVQAELWTQAHFNQRLHDVVEQVIAK